MGPSDHGHKQSGRSTSDFASKKEEYRRYKDGPEDQEQVHFQADEELRPLLFVDINLGEDQVERIIVFEGNTAAQLAADFSDKHGKYLL